VLRTRTVYRDCTCYQLQTNWTDSDRYHTVLWTTST